MIYSFLQTQENHLKIILILLDPSAAFETSDHNIFPDCLENCVGIKCMAFILVKSYILLRSFYFAFNDTSRVCSETSFILHLFKSS